MAKRIDAFVDDRGHLYKSPQKAILADLASALGPVGDEGGLTHGVALLILEKRAEIEKAFREFDQLVLADPKVIDVRNFKQA